MSEFVAKARRTLLFVSGFAHVTVGSIFLSNSLSRPSIGALFIILPVWMVLIGLSFLIASISTKAAHALRISVILLVLIQMMLAIPFVLVLLALTGMGGPPSETPHNPFMLKAFGALFIYWVVLGLCAWAAYIVGRKKPASSIN